MILQIKNHEELSTLIHALGKEIVDANIYHRLHRDLIQALDKNQKVHIESKTYWYLTLTALKETSMIHLCRFYDQETKSLCIHNLLDTIRHYIQYFEKDSFKERLKNNPFVEGLAEDNRLPNLDQLLEHIEFSSNKNPLVKKLMIWRNNIYAHKGAKSILNEHLILSENKITSDELKMLLDQGYKILNQYSDLYRASSWSRKIVGHDDYNALFKFFSIGFQKWDEERQQEIEKIKKGLRNKTVEMDWAKTTPFISSAYILSQ